MILRTYKNIYNQFLTDSNIELAYKNFAKGRSKNGYVIRFHNNPIQEIAKIKQYVMSDAVESHKSKQIFCQSSGKIRTIIRPTYQEQIVQHMAVNILKPIFLKSMYPHSHGSIPNRGCQSGKKRLAKWIRKDYRGTKYYLKMDIRKYFENINHDILKHKLAKIIKDDKFLQVLYKCIDINVDGHTLERGIPLGFYTSQWFANFYLTEFDHFVKEKLHAKYYIRYMDDLVILGGNKRKLRRMAKNIKEYLQVELDIELKDTWLLNKLGTDDKHSLDFMGFRFYRNRTTLRKKLAYRITKKAKRIYKRKLNIRSARQFLSYTGWTTHANVYQMYQNLVKPFCNRRRVRKYVSNYERRQYELT